MKNRSGRTSAKPASDSRLSSAIFWTTIALLFLIPLAFTTALPAAYSLPKFVLLLVGSSVIALLLAINASRKRSSTAPLFHSRQVKLVCLYFLMVALSAVFGVAPLVSLFGSNSNFMGLLTRLCYVVCFFGLVAGIGASEERLLKALWVISISGGLVAAYAVLQFFGIEPFASASVYTFASPLGSVKRVCSSIGHSNYLGNYLLYIAPLSLGLGLATKKKERLLAALISALALLAIVFSVARGAWVGILVGLIFFIALECKAMLSKQPANKKTLLRYGAIFLVVFITVLGAIAFSPASRSIKERVQALRTEGISSSGRLLLWRDSLKMLPAYALTGCGPEGFRKAFLAYKSPEVTRLSQPNNNESPHNSYLDAAISYGLPGLALYLALIVSTFVTLLRARRRAISADWRILLSGLLSSFIAVLAHNFFIFDQLSTGLYFFAFLAFAPVVSNVFGDQAAPEKASQDAAKAKSGTGRTPSSQNGSPLAALRMWAGRALSAVAALALVVSLWYCAGLLEAERAFTKIFDPAIAGNFPAIANRCAQVANSPLPTGAYSFMAARALDTYAKSLQTLANSPGQSAADSQRLEAIRQNALQAGIGYVERSLAHTNTPDLNYTLLASMALALGDKEKLKSAASEAVKYDPYNYHAGWLMAEAFWASGETEEAAREAETALEFYPDHPGAVSVLVRIHNRALDKTREKIERQLVRPPDGKGREIEEMLRYARQLAQEGNLQKAKRKLLMAIARSSGNCPDCHRELAGVYEKLKLNRDAIIEWETYAQQAPDRAAAEQVSLRIESLKQQGPGKLQ
jgi:O-antigen ligase/tetratricopeptide (TPR) repeat protein